MAPSPTSVLLLSSLLQASTAFSPATPRTVSAPRTWTGSPTVAPAKRKGDLFQEIAELEDESMPVPEILSGPATKEPAPTPTPAKEKAILAPEETFFEAPPSWTEIVIPAVSVLTVIGIIPFIATLTRQAWVKYKVTSRRISVTSGFNSQDLTEITYDEIFSMKFVYRALGDVGDMVIELRDGAKLEIRSLGGEKTFDEIYQYIFERTDSECQEYSDKTRSMKAAAQ